MSLTGLKSLRVERGLEKRIYDDEYSVCHPAKVLKELAMNNNNNNNTSYKSSQYVHNMYQEIGGDLESAHVPPG